MYLGQVLPPQASAEEEKIFILLYELAYQYFPQDAAKAESWVQEQASKYGIVYGKMKAKETGTSIWNSPITWIVISVVAMFLFSKRR